MRHCVQQEVSAYIAVITLNHINVDEVSDSLRYDTMSIGEWLLTSSMGLLTPSLGSTQTKKTRLLTPTR